MRPLYKSRCIIAGSIIALFALFFPLVEGTNVSLYNPPGYQYNHQLSAEQNLQDSILYLQAHPAQINFTATAYSIYSKALQPGGEIYWTIIACVLLSFFMGIASAIKQNWIITFLLVAFQLSSTISFLWSLFQNVATGSATANAVAAFCETVQDKCYTADGVALSQEVTVRLGLGFWLLVVGLLISACGIYAPSNEKTNGSEEKSPQTGSTNP